MKPDTTTELQRPCVVISPEECKGCARCVQACPNNVLILSNQVNSQGLRVAEAAHPGCTGCGICFYNCPEPGAITVYKKA